MSDTTDEPPPNVIDLKDKRAADELPAWFVRRMTSDTWGFGLLLDQRLAEGEQHLAVLLLAPRQVGVVSSQLVHFDVQLLDGSQLGAATPSATPIECGVALVSQLVDPLGDLHREGRRQPLRQVVGDLGVDPGGTVNLLLVGCIKAQP